MMDPNQAEKKFTQAELDLKIPQVFPVVSESDQLIEKQKRALQEKLQTVFSGFNVLRTVVQKHRDQSFNICSVDTLKTTMLSLTPDVKILTETAEIVSRVLSNKPDSAEQTEKLKTIRTQNRQTHSEKKGLDYEKPDLFSDLSLQDLEILSETLHTPLHDLKTPLTTIVGRMELATYAYLRINNKDDQYYQNTISHLQKMRPYFSTLTNFFTDNFDQFVGEAPVVPTEINLDQISDQLIVEVLPIFETALVKDYSLENLIPENIKKQQVLIHTDLNLYATITREVGYNVCKALEERARLDRIKGLMAPNPQVRLRLSISPDQRFLEISFKANGQSYPDEFVYIPNDPAHPGNFIRGKHGRQTEVTGIQGSGMAMFEHQQKLRELEGDIIPLNPAEGGSETVIKLPLIGWQYRLPE